MASLYSMNGLLAIAIVTLVGWPASSALAREYECSEVGADWVELGWHIAARVEYKIVSGREVTFELGTGIFAWGEPRGSKYTATGFAEVDAYGYGSLVARSLTGRAEKICFTATNLDPITIYSSEF